MKRWSVTFENAATGTRTTRRFWTERSARGWWLFLMAEGNCGSWPVSTRHASVTSSRAGDQ